MSEKLHSAKNDTTLEKKQLKNRFRATLDHLGFEVNKKKFASTIGVGRVTLDKSYSGESIPSLYTASKLATKYKGRIDYIWLLTGEGEMLPEHKPNNKHMSELQDSKANYGYSLEERIDFLREIHEKDKKIGELQDEVSRLKQKIIDMLEKQMRNLSK